MWQNIEDIKNRYNFKKCMSEFPPLEQDILRLLSHIATQEKKLAEAVECLKYYSFPENHETQTVFNKEKRRDEYGSAIKFCDNYGAKARQLLAKLGKEAE